MADDSCQWYGQDGAHDAEQQGAADTVVWNERTQRHGMAHHEGLGQVAFDLLHCDDDDQHVTASPVPLVTKVARTAPATVAPSSGTKAPKDQQGQGQPQRYAEHEEPAPIDVASAKAISAVPPA